MDKTEAINVAFLAGVIIVLVAAFVYVNAFYEEPEEEEEDAEEETGALVDVDVPANDAEDAVASSNTTSPASALYRLSCC